MSNVILEWKPQTQNGKKKPSLKELENYYLKQIDEQLEIDKRDVIFIIGKEGSKYSHEFHDPIIDTVKPNQKVNIIDFLKYTDDYIGFYNNKKPVIVIVMDEEGVGYEILRSNEEIEAFGIYFKKNRMKRAWETARKFLEERKATN
ncbi:MAG: hypothetical protein IJI14_08675 [Anaerolineaceae bacterium]|nr:hypothetical protein [Anaerolineaceae bacterium]